MDGLVCGGKECGKAENGKERRMLLGVQDEVERCRNAVTATRRMRTRTKRKMLKTPGKQREKMEEEEKREVKERGERRSNNGKK